MQRLCYTTAPGWVTSEEKYNYPAVRRPRGLGHSGAHAPASPEFLKSDKGLLSPHLEPHLQQERNKLTSSIKRKSRIRGHVCTPASYQSPLTAAAAVAAAAFFAAAAAVRLDIESKSHE